MEKIPGPALCGFDDVFVGATPPKPPAAKPTSAPPGQKQLAKGPVKKGTVARTLLVDKSKSPYKASLLSALNAGQAAIAIAKKAKASVKQHGAVKHAPVSKIAVTRVTGEGEIVLGAVAKGLTPKQKAAVEKHVKAITRNALANKRLNIAAAQAQRAGEKALALVTKTAPIFAKALAEKPGKGEATRVRGVDDALGLIDECLGLIEELGQDASVAQPDPNNPGYLTDGSVDPAYGAGGGAGASGGAGGVDASGIVTDPNGNILYDPSAPDPDIIPMPVRQPAGYKPDPAEMRALVVDMPADGIPFGPAMGKMVDQSKGSWDHYFSPSTGKQVKNYDGGPSPGSTTANLDWGRGFIFTRKGTSSGFDQGEPRWMFLREGNNQVDDPRDIGTQYNSPVYVPSGVPVPPGVPMNIEDAPAAQASSDMGWGPIIGNPFDPATAGLQYAIVNKTWFWQGKNAPAANTQAIDSKIAQLNAETVTTKTKAAVAKAAQMAKDATDAAEAQAKQEAENALRESKATSEATAAATAQETQKGQLDLETQKAELTAAAAQTAVETAQAQTDVTQRQADIEAQKAEQAQLVQQAAVWNQWAAAHPEEAVAQMQQQGISTDEGGGGDEGAPAYAEDEAPAEEPAPADEGEEEALPDNGGDEGGAGVLDELLGSLDRLFGDDGDGPDDVDRRRQEGGG